jgi:hypothetical protein
MPNTTECIFPSCDNEFYGEGHHAAPIYPENYCCDECNRQLMIYRILTAREQQKKKSKKK